jgi:hypothetical protein
MEWPMAAVLIAVVFALMVIVTSWVSAKKS